MCDIRNFGFLWATYGETEVSLGESYDDMESGRSITVERQDLETLLKEWPNEEPPQSTATS